MGGELVGGWYFGRVLWEGWEVVCVLLDCVDWVWSLNGLDMTFSENGIITPPGTPHVFGRRRKEVPNLVPVSEHLTTASMCCEWIGVYMEICK